jgi:hypothetical protein
MRRTGTRRLLQTMTAVTALAQNGDYRCEQKERVGSSVDVVPKLFIFKPFRFLYTPRHDIIMVLPVIEEPGNLLHFEPPAYIVHQTNCVTTQAHGLSHHVQKVMGKNDCVYARRPALVGERNATSRPSAPGTIRVILGKRNVVNLMGQLYPGKPGQYNTEYDKYYNKMLRFDDREARERYFVQGLRDLAGYIKDFDIDSDIVFPKNIGSGLAGGYWPDYRQHILAFAESVPNVVRIVDFNAAAAKAD